MATLQRTMSQVMDKEEGEDMSAGENCPTATQDITINLRNRAKAINSANYGPENPDLPNTAFWKKKADEWEVSIEDAKMSRCGNCAAFNQEESMLDCIEKGIGGEGDAEAMQNRVEKRIAQPGRGAEEARFEAGQFADRLPAGVDIPTHPARTAQRKGF